MCREVTQRCLIHWSSIARSLTVITISVSDCGACLSVLIGHKTRYWKMNFPFFFLGNCQSVQLVPGGVEEMIWLAVFTLHFEIICLEKVKARLSDFKMLPHCSENVRCISITYKKHHQAARAQGFLVQLNLLLLLFFSCPACLALLSLWHCPAFPLSVCLSVCLSLILSAPLSRLCSLFLNDDTERQL